MSHCIPGTHGHCSARLLHEPDKHSVWLDICTIVPIYGALDRGVQFFIVLPLQWCRYSSRQPMLNQRLGLCPSPSIDQQNSGRSFITAARLSVL